MLPIATIANTNRIGGLNTGSNTNAFGASATKPTGFSFGSSAPVQPQANSTFGGNTASTGFGAANNATSTGFGAANNTTGGFGANNATSTGFGAANNTTGGFGANNAASTGFGAANTASGFGAANNTTSGFGANNAASTGFGAANTASGFGAANNTTSGFGSNNAASTGFGAANTASGFGAANNTTSGFGANTAGTGFGATNTAGGFGAANNTTSGFGANTAGTGFGAKTSTGFGANTSGGLFGAKPTTSLFGSMPTTGSGAAAPSTGLFGSNASGNTLGGLSQQPQQQLQQLNLNAMTRVGDLPDAIRQEIEAMNRSIQQQVSTAERLTNDEAQHSELITSIPRDIEYLSSKVISTNQALNQDVKNLASLKSLCDDVVADSEKLYVIIKQLSTPGTRINSNDLNNYFFKKIDYYTAKLAEYAAVVNSSEEAVNGIERDAVEGIGGMNAIIGVLQEQYSLFMELSNAMAEIHQETKQVSSLIRI
ncbi:hypothetical protein BABINDRAFT_162234 [Babjeviella inositovora NRRL Y-12698]|uniref:Nucleoporin NSP1-like C-terminal domain-containing protein n=1 Tax=Babjeviella inositovora NRRL Y-12698 TaxID=984486 RepID=A0A1E3QP18_9ASCO|nr:uncharacterized protein BABINDRAFT_162234 [Babjeviella inositovora NRRL Y-12698]ODQ79194.1 hypothetical protein BABINDRAFT_162234 [Babjeviella inositovora NRRL Y-12698]